MKRREFIAYIGGLTVWPLVARAQPGGVPVIGVLNSASPSGAMLSLNTSFRQGLTEAGYNEGRNIAIETRWAEGQYDRLPAMAADFVKRDVALIEREVAIPDKTGSSCKQWIIRPGNRRERYNWVTGDH